MVIFSIGESWQFRKTGWPLAPLRGRLAPQNRPLAYAICIQAVKSLTGLLVYVYVFLRGTHLSHGNHLVILVLFFDAHAHIAL